MEGGPVRQNERENMKTIMVSYPQFRSLPKGVRRMLLTSEQHFFDEAKSDPSSWVSKLSKVKRSQAAPTQPYLPRWWNHLGGANQKFEGQAPLSAGQW